MRYARLTLNLVSLVLQLYALLIVFGWTVPAALFLAGLLLGLFDPHAAYHARGYLLGK